MGSHEQLQGVRLPCPWKQGWLVMCLVSRGVGVSQIFHAQSFPPRHHLSVLYCGMKG